MEKQNYNDLVNSINYMESLLLKNIENCIKSNQGIEELYKCAKIVIKQLINLLPEEERKSLWFDFKKYD